ASTWRRAALPPLLRAEGLWLRAGDRVALLGANGTGKSSLLRQCWRELAAQSPQADWYCHPGASIAYYDQSLQQLADGATLSDALYPLAPLPETTRRQALIRAGFPYVRHGQQVHTLSGGERARLLFLALSLGSHHMLWLDEPTNHLDLAGKEQLAEAIAAFPGGVLLVSHDRELIERSCNRFWLIKDGRIQEAHSAERAYAELLGDAPSPAADKASLAAPAMGQAPAGPADDEEALLARWYELDALLAADLARKPRHQTPRLQQQWRDELTRLTDQLGLVGS
ncbi:ATP-binding cassette domain-containing protein, partial [Aeromonas hydrophila]